MTPIGIICLTWHCNECYKTRSNCELMTYYDEYKIKCTVINICSSMIHPKGSMLKVVTILTQHSTILFDRQHCIIWLLRCWIGWPYLFWFPDKQMVIHAHNFGIQTIFADLSSLQHAHCRQYAIESFCARISYFWQFLQNKVNWTFQ